MNALPTRKLEAYRYADIDALAAVWSDLSLPEPIEIAAQQKLQQIWLPSADEVAERSRQAGQALTVQQVVERDWALRRDSNKSAPQRCKVLGGSVDGAMAHVVFEADLNGRRQRGTATLLQADKAWRVRDHGDWAQVK